MNRILRCFIGADMRLAHDGLRLIAKKHKVDTNTLINGEHVIFMNHAKDKLKLFSANNVITYLRMDRGRKIDLRVIQLIPSIYGSTGGIDYDRGIREILIKELDLKEYPINQGISKNETNRKINTRTRISNRSLSREIP